MTTQPIWLCFSGKIFDGVGSHALTLLQGTNSASQINIDLFIIGTQEEEKA